jgi:hypothetical protein
MSAAQNENVEPEEQPELPGMPEQPDAVARAIQWLEQHWGPDGHPCPYCGTSLWTVTPPFFFSLVPADREYGIPIGAAEFFGVSCTNCGQTVFINRSAHVDPPEDGEDEVGEDPRA